METIKTKIQELVGTLNNLSNEDIADNKEMLIEELSFLHQFNVDFLNIVNCPNKKPITFEMEDYPIVMTQRDEIIKLLRDNPGYYDIDQICYCVCGSKDGIRSILRHLVTEGILIKSPAEDSKAKLIWRIAKR